MFEFDLPPGFRPGSTCRAWRAARTAPGGEGGTGAAGGGGGTGGTGGTGASGATGAKTFTQEELDKIVGQRVGEERAKYPDYDKYKADSTELAGIKDKDKTPDQRYTDLQTQLATEKAAREKAEADRDSDRKATELAQLRAERADKVEGFPKSLVKSLTGDTAETIDTHIKEIMAELGLDGDKRPDGSGGSSRGGGNDAKPSTMAAGTELYEKLHPKSK